MNPARGIDPMIHCTKPDKLPLSYNLPSFVVTLFCIPDVVVHRNDREMNYGDITRGPQ